MNGSSGLSGELEDTSSLDLFPSYGFTSSGTGPGGGNGAPTGGAAGAAGAAGAPLGGGSGFGPTTGGS